MSTRPGQTLWESLANARYTLTRSCDLSVGTIIPDGALLTTGNSLTVDTATVSHGSWKSAPIGVGSGYYLGGTITWIESAPSGTRIDVFSSIDGGHTWIPVQNGGDLLAPFYGQSLSGCTVYVLVSLAASGATTPSVSGLSVTIDGVSFPVPIKSTVGQTLRNALNSPFAQDARAFLALTISYDGAMQWTISDFTLTTQTAGGSGRPLSIFLPLFDLDALSEYISAQSGYAVSAGPGTAGAYSAVVLMDGTGNASEMNGDTLYAYGSTLWVETDAVGWETAQAESMVVQALDQMDIDSAATPWLDEWGSYFGIARNGVESDPAYAQRIEGAPFTLRCNNKAIENLVSVHTGYRVRVVDLPWAQTNFLTTNPSGYLSQGVHIFAQVTNSSAYVAGPRDSSSNNGQLLSSLGITAGPFGYPLWGNPANNNPLVCAFAVLLGSAAIPAPDLEAIQSVIRASRMAGTVALYFEPGAVFVTNDVADVTNGPMEVGPATSAYTQVVTPS